ncbi:MAG: glycosyltransferase, partial [Thermodesulfobacteriota bacterium]
MKKSLISCIVPVFNGERYLRESLESILGQTYRNFEVIVVDDGSTDGTAALVKDFENIRYFSQPNKGTSSARNLGLSESQGEFVAFLDADDLWHKEKLEKQMARFQIRPELDYCITHVKNFWIPELIKEKQNFKHHRHSEALPGFVTQSLMARRIFFEEIGYFNTTLRYSDDTEWFMRAAEHGAVMELLPDVLVFRRIHHNNLSRQEASESREEYLLLVKAFLDRRRS